MQTAVRSAPGARGGVVGGVDDRQRRRHDAREGHPHRRTHVVSLCKVEKIASRWNLVAQAWDASPVRVVVTLRDSANLYNAQLRRAVASCKADTDRLQFKTDCRIPRRTAHLSDAQPTFLALRTVPSGASVLGSTDLEDSTSVIRYATPDAAPAGSVGDGKAVCEDVMDVAMRRNASDLQITDCKTETDGDSKQVHEAPVISATSAPSPGMERATASATSAAPMGARPSGVCNRN